MSRNIPIIFSAPMVLALLREAAEPGTGKTMTRRLAWRHAVAVMERDRAQLERKGHLFERMRGAMNTQHWASPPSPWQAVKPGDRLYVRESHWRYGRWDAVKKAGKTSYTFVPLREPSDLPDVIHAADAAESADAAGRKSPPERGKFGDPLPGWHLRPSIFLPREFSRLTLVVTATKIEKLQEISDKDAIAEGIVYVRRSLRLHGRMDGYGLDEKAPGDASPTPRGAFCKLWQSLHGGESWHANPEVVALTFQVHAENIDSLKIAA